MIEFSCQNDLFGHRAANDWMWVRLESEPVAAGIFQGGDRRGWNKGGDRGER